MTGPIDATLFPEAEVALAHAVKAVMPTVYAGIVTPSPIPTQAVIFGFSGSGFRSWGEASVNVGVNVYDTTDEGCRALVTNVLNALAVLSNDHIEYVSVPTGATSIPRQSPPFQRYFAVTVHLRGQSVL